jgi:fructose-1,6-bisphosphatase/inositol monophosphatase family enzyme
LLIEEAGGVVSYYGGDPNIIESRLMIASNPHIHSEIARVVLEPPSIQRTQAEEIQKH